MSTPSLVVVVGGGQDTVTRRGGLQLLLLRGIWGLVTPVQVLCPPLPVPLPPASLPGGLLVILQTPLRGEPADMERRSPLGLHPTSVRAASLGPRFPIFKAEVM